jgi:N-acetylneuraminate synthase
MSVLIIAEAGVNHNGSVDRALAMVDAAARAGADMVKFQSFRTEELVTETVAMAPYQTRTEGGDGKQFAMLKALELNRAGHDAVAERCARQGIGFLSTPFDIPSLHMLVGEMGLGLVKLSSGEITNGPLLLAAGRSGARIILSTGMSDLDEVEAALSVLAFGLTRPEGIPTPQSLRDAMDSPAGRAALAERVTLLHCTTEYPTPYDEVNLRAMHSLRERFGLVVGLSDHTPGTVVSAAAVALGAQVIEKHFTLDRSLPGPDHAASLEPDELARLVREIRAVEAALGDGVKRVTASEAKNIAVVRRSVVARTAIAAGEPFTEANLTIRRAGGSIPAMEYWALLGRPAPRAYAAAECIEP